MVDQKLPEGELYLTNYKLLYILKEGYGYKSHVKRFFCLPYGLINSVEQRVDKYESFIDIVAKDHRFLSFKVVKNDELSKLLVKIKEKVFYDWNVYDFKKELVVHSFAKAYKEALNTGPF